MLPLLRGMRVVALIGLVAFLFVQQRSAVRRRLVIVVAAVVVICSSLFILLSPDPPSAASNSEPQLAPWAFPGAYANYSGSATLPNGIPYTLQFELRVLAVNGAKAEVVSLMAIQARNKPLSIHRNAAWLRATRSGGRPLELVTNDSLYLTFDSTATVMNKTIPVTVYYYDNKGDTTILFVKKEIGIPVQIEFGLDNVTSILVRLVKTNISGLVG